MKNVLTVLALATPCVLTAQDRLEELVQEPVQEVEVVSVDHSFLLTYTNQWTFTYVSPSGTTDSQEVVLPDGNTAIISWRINRTANSLCTGSDPAEPEVCADRISVTPMQGWVAIPSEAIVNEHDSIEILIIPELFG